MGEPVPAAKVTTLVRPSAATVGDEYSLTVADSPIFVAGYKDALSPGRELDRNQTHDVTIEQESGGIFARSATANEANVEIALQGNLGITVVSRPPRVIKAMQENRTGIVGDTITPGAGGATFSSQEVPNGFDVVVQNQHGTDSVFVQDDGGTERHEIGPGDFLELGVANLNQITVTGTVNNPTVVATVEAP